MAIYTSAYTGSQIDELLGKADAIGDGILTLNTSGIATGSQTFSANQNTNVTFTVDVPATNIAQGTRTSTTVLITSSTGTDATLDSATQTEAGLLSSTDKSKLDGIASNANNYTLPLATLSDLGGVKLGSDTTQTITANSVSATESRSYAIQVNSSEQLVVNVPWDTPGNGTLSIGSSTAGQTNTSIDLNLSGSYSANTTDNRTVNAVIGPSISALASTMTGSGTGFLRKNGQDTYSIDTTSYLPDLGIPPINNDALAASLSNGIKKWIQLSSGLKIANDLIIVDEDTVAIDTTGFTYSTSTTLSNVLTDLDTNIALAVGGRLSVVTTDTSLTGNGTANSPISVAKWATPITLTLSGDIQGNGSIDGSGNVTIQTTTVISGSDTISITKSLTLTDDWQDVGIQGADLSTGSYIIQLYANDVGAGGTNNNEYYTGVMSWYSSSTTELLELPNDEIILHRAGAGSDSGIYLRTYRSNVLKLQVFSNIANASASNYVFKFRRMI